MVRLNQHGVDLDNLPVDTEEFVPIHTDQFGRMIARVLHADVENDEFTVQYGTNYEVFERVVGGDAFRPPVEFIDGFITPDEFTALEPGDQVIAFLRGDQTIARVRVKNTDDNMDRVLIHGEYNANTVHHWVSRTLVKRP